MHAEDSAPSLFSGRYVIYGEIASGGMASVHYGRVLGAAGFSRAVAIKRLHPNFAREAEFVAMFIDEARICARLSHANLVSTLDVLQGDGELALVMEYVHGFSLEALLDLTRAARAKVPVRVATGLIAGVLHGLHAAHQARGEHGEELAIIHRDVSPQNIMVGADGVPRVLDFGIAKARVRLRNTPSGEFKGKLSYMAPEQFSAGEIDRRVDVYGASVVLWELLVGRTLFEGSSEAQVVRRVLSEPLLPPSRERPEVSAELDALVMRGLSRDPNERFSTAREMAAALERLPNAVSQSELSDWVHHIAGMQLAAHAARLAEMRRSAEAGVPVPAITSSEQSTPLTRRLSSGASFERSAPAQSTPVRSKRGKRIALFVALSGLTIAGGYALVAMRNEEPSQQQLQAHPPPALPRPPSRSAEPARLPPTHTEQSDWKSAVALVDAGALTDAASAVVQAEIAAQPADAATAPQAAPRPKKVRAQPRAPDCRQPFVIDARGVKRWKPECL